MWETPSTTGVFQGAVGRVGQFHRSTLYTAPSFAPALFLQTSILLRRDKALRRVLPCFLHLSQFIAIPGASITALDELTALRLGAVAIAPTPEARTTPQRSA